MTRKQKSEQQQTISWSNLEHKPFWVWDKEDHLKLALETNQNCCFNHIVGLPINQKTGLPNPMFD